MNKYKYLTGLIGLAIGFGVAFSWTQKFNRENASTATSSASAPQAAAGGAGGQQAMMGQVAQTIEKAKTNPKDFDAQKDAASLFYQIGRTAEAVEFLEKAHEIDPTRFSALKAEAFMAQSYAQQKKYAESEAWFDRAIDANPGDAEIYAVFAETYVNREPPLPDKAIEQIQLALKIDPKNGHALRHLVEAYALKKDKRLAEEAFARLKQADPASEEIAKVEPVITDLKAGKPVTIPKE